MIDDKEKIIIDYIDIDVVEQYTKTTERSPESHPSSHYYYNVPPLSLTQNREMTKFTSG